MAYTILDICNQALRDLGEMPIVSLNEPDKVSRACAGLWDSARDYTQSLYEWPECLTRQQLAESLPPPAFEWGHRFHLPSDCLRIVSLYEHEEPFNDWEIEGEAILTNHGSARILYIRRNNEVPSWSQLLIRCVRYRLAADLVPSIKASLEHKQLYENMFMQAMATARGRSPRINKYISRDSSFVTRRW